MRLKFDTLEAVYKAAIGYSFIIYMLCTLILGIVFVVSYPARWVIRTYEKKRYRNNG